jgi:hypothetical protein
MLWAASNAIRVIWIVKQHLCIYCNMQKAELLSIGNRKTPPELWILFIPNSYEAESKAQSAASRARLETDTHTNTNYFPQRLPLSKANWAIGLVVRKIDHLLN